MIAFRLAPHSVHPDRQVVEVLINGQVSATITGDSFASLNEIRIITRHLDGSPVLSGETDCSTDVTINVIQIFLKRKD